MKVRLTPRALQDLHSIAEYIRAENSPAAERVRASIIEALETLSEFPEIGRMQTVEGVRKYVSRKFGYLIYYTVDRTAADVHILSIQHPARERKFEDN